MSNAWSKQWCASVFYCRGSPLHISYSQDIPFFLYNSVSYYSASTVNAGTRQRGIQQQRGHFLTLLLSGVKIRQKVSYTIHKFVEGILLYIMIQIKSKAEEKLGQSRFASHIFSKMFFHINGKMIEVFFLDLVHLIIMQRCTACWCIHYYVFLLLMHLLPRFPQRIYYRFFFLLNGPIQGLVLLGALWFSHSCDASDSEEPVWPGRAWLRPAREVPRSSPIIPHIFLIPRISSVSIVKVCYCPTLYLHCISPWVKNRDMVRPKRSVSEVTFETNWLGFAFWLAFR